MFPNVRQRAVVLAAVVAGGLLFQMGLAEARAADGAAGCTLFLAASPVHALLTFIALAVPVVLLASLGGGLGNPMAGVFAATAALVFAAVGGGSIDATLRSADSARVYLTLAAEAVAWGTIVAGIATGCLKLSQRLAPRVHEPQPAPQPSAPEPTAKKSEAAGLPRNENGDVLGVGWAVVQSIAHKARLSDTLVQLLLSGVVAAAVGGVLAALLVRSTDPWQAVWGLAIAFSLAGLLAHQLFPAPNPIAILVAPLVAAAGCYVVQAIIGGSGDAFLAAYFHGRLIGPALALPIYYASAGAAGAAVGIGWSQVVFFTREHKDEDEELPQPHVPAET